MSLVLEIKEKKKVGVYFFRFYGRFLSITQYIVDDCELWFSMKKKTASGLPCMLWSNNRNIVDFFANCFNESWKNQNASSLQISKI